ncbi:CRAL-TRIO domain-containing protein [Haematococcus lacustris]|uniref:CRAL-TRIO domain-containing protein n=1 Tax=Haematococcus lacustris TaxID=44745 RepID=A0A6A0AAQ7_HAELA|nr:CRAL-TRIO domain-containing protein [Haematococcus lacustris]
MPGRRDVVHPQNQTESRAACEHFENPLLLASGNCKLVIGSKQCYISVACRLAGRLVDALAIQLSGSHSLACRLRSRQLHGQPQGCGPSRGQARRSKSMTMQSSKLNDETLQWYLRDRYFDVDEAEQKLRRMLAWREDFQPDHITASQVAKEASSGKAYVHSHLDVYGRPAIVIRTRLHVVGQYPINDSKRLAVFLIDQAIAQAQSAGGEQILGIFDLRDFQVPRNSDFLFARFMVEAFFEYYPRRVAQVLFVEAPWMFQPAWAAIQPLMRKYAALVRFVSKEELAREYFTPNTTPDEFK